MLPPEVSSAHVFESSTLGNVGGELCLSGSRQALDGEPLAVLVVQERLVVDRTGRFVARRNVVQVPRALLLGV